MAVVSYSAITVAQAKTFSGVTSSDFDTEIEEIVNAAAGFMRGYTGRRLVIDAAGTTLTEYHDGQGFGHHTLYPREWPVNSVTTLHVDYNRDFGANTLIDSSGFIIDQDNTAIRLFAPAATTGYAPSYFGRGVRNIKLVYNGGYVTVPEDLRTAAKMIVEAWIEDSSIDGLGQGTLRRNQIDLGGDNVLFTDTTGVPQKALQILDHYKRQEPL